ncbi:hypothetical protein [Cellulosimicrobium sp. JZ28]|uniref:hypothetical protein n=1 Tax=Cellulosimicrobium sp. JZ28 TaxID=1906273 RepID=UPI00188C87D7|nr:hypothetical protein [Cellulosimicrobium sp. JZ28]
MPATLNDSQRDRLAAVAARTADLTSTERAGWRRLRDAYQGDDRALIATALGETAAAPSSSISPTVLAQLQQRFPTHFPA